MTVGELVRFLSGVDRNTEVRIIKPNGDPESSHKVLELSQPWFKEDNEGFLYRVDEIYQRAFDESHENEIDSSAKILAIGYE